MSLGPGRTGLCIPFSGYHFEAVRRPILFGRLLGLTILARIDSLSQHFTCVMEIFTQFPRYAHYLLPILRIINTKSKTLALPPAPFPNAWTYESVLAFWQPRMTRSFFCTRLEIRMPLGGGCNLNPIHYCPKTKTGIINNYISLRALYTRAGDFIFISWKV
jgi:hypothetical protein